jgi:hypothetical protein
MAASIYTKSIGFQHEKQCITMQNMAFRKPKDGLLQDRTRLNGRQFNTSKVKIEGQKFTERT